MSTTGKGGMGIGWPDFWALFDEDDENDQKKLSEAISRDDSFYRWFKRRSTKHQKEVLEGAPLTVVLLLIHCLPRKEATAIAKSFPEDRYEEISRAYFHPGKRESSTGQTQGPDVPRLPSGDKPAGRSVSVPKKVRRGT